MTRLWGSVLRAFIFVALAVCILPTTALASDDNRSDSYYYLPSWLQLHIVEAFCNYDDFESSIDLSSYGNPVPYDTAVSTVRDLMIDRDDTIKVAVSVDDVNSASEFAQKLVDDALLECSDPHGGDYLRYNLKYWSSSVAYYTGGSTFWVSLSLTYNTTSAQEQQVDEDVNSLINSLNLSSLSDYEKIEAIYDWVCLNVDYDYNHANDSTYRAKYTAYGALCNRSAVCQGYAVLFYRLCEEAGLDTRVIPGTSSTSDGQVSHAWNIVCLKNHYYNVDATWDAGLTTGSTPSHAYFLKTDADYADDHTRKAAYQTSAFYTSYPMATEPYSNDSTATYLFSDTPADAWYVKNGTLEFVVSHGLMSGKSATSFQPDANISRAEVAMILYNLAQKPDVPAEAAEFSDVPADAWYYDAVMWARSAGVVNGVSETMFNPNASVTREQYAVMLRNYAEKVAGISTTASLSSISSYSDASTVSSWAKYAVAWCVEAGIMSGYEDSSLRPKNSATRAVAAQMIRQFYELVY